MCFSSKCTTIDGVRFIFGFDVLIVKWRAAMTSFHGGKCCAAAKRILRTYPAALVSS